ncbi:aspartyl-phosphate phosphatase Spo0E family protein [Cytobacillus sp. BC1816]|uniref:aspartyl-phosphate phosphatase Spo0E family protein n=1 Tax=Cytobacillus sp. BC1816 TaxID=3440154 RepID=UPI003F51A141
MKPKKRPLANLISENKQELIKDTEVLDNIETVVEIMERESIHTEKENNLLKYKSEQVKLNKAIEEKRGSMIDSILKYGITNSLTVQLSQELDYYILSYLKDSLKKRKHPHQLRYTK